MKKFNITPKPRMLLGVQNQKWNVTGALAELIDNSFGQGRGNASMVKIVYDTTNRTLTVIDNGRGMEYIGRLFQLGNTIGHTAGDIGHFGSGGTQAIIWLSEWVHVLTERKGKFMEDRVKWSDIFEMNDFSNVAVSNEWQKGQKSTDLAEWGQGTVIHMKLGRGRKPSPSNIIRDLSRLFAPGLRRGKRIIWCQQRAGEIQEERPLDDPFEAKTAPADTVHFDIVVAPNDDVHLPVRGVISFDDSISHNDSLIRVGFGHREIMRTRDCFKSDDEAFAGIGVSGWLDLGDGWQPYLSTTKDAFDDQLLYETLMEHVFVEIRELLVRAEQAAIDFELDNLAVGLEMALEKTMKMKVSVVREPEADKDEEDDEEEEGDEEGDEESEEEEIVDPEPPDDPPTDPDSKGEEESPAIARIRLIKQKDENMLGALARSGTDPLGIYVDINREHPYVSEAMRQRPINSAALNLMIVHEIAALLTDDAALAHKAFKKSINDELEKHEGSEKVRILVRYMIDNVPNKHRQAAE